MKVVKALAPAALFAVIFCAGADAEDSKTGGPAQPEGVPAKEFKAKAGYCETCHGLSARGFTGTNPMPRLAGQQPDYIKNQLQAFIDRRRLNPVMGNVAHVLSPAMVDALATHFKDLDPPPYGGAPRDLMSEGEKIYHEGVPSAEVPACESCHGQDAHGMDQFPRLAGQRRFCQRPQIIFAQVGILSTIGPNSRNHAPLLSMPDGSQLGTSPRINRDRL